MFSVHPPLIIRLVNKNHLICSIPEREKIIYLTFDDGPVPEVTTGVLNILRDRNISATFFCVGDNVRKFPEIFKEVSFAGHSIGNHTFHHLNGWKTPPAEYLEDVTRCDDYLTTALFRPPYGRITPSQYFLLRKRYKIILWSVLSGDFNQRIPKEQCLLNVLNYTKPGSIVVFHDSIKAKENLFYALPLFLDAFIQKGYKFERLNNCDKKFTL